MGRIWFWKGFGETSWLADFNLKGIMTSWCFCLLFPNFFGQDDLPVDGLHIFGKE